jgi:hypothetical protein
MPQAQPGGPATATTAQIMPYLGFNEALKKWGMGNEVSIVRDLKWQKDVDGNTQKIKQFQDVVGGLQEFQTYLFIKLGSAFVTVLHLPMKFVAISEVTQHLQGRFVGFVGDHMAMKDPTPIILPQKKMWKWEMKTTSSDVMALGAYYTADSTQRGRLWVLDQAEAHEWTAMKAPLLLAIPLVLFRALWEEGKLLMPHAIRGLVVAFIYEVVDVAKASVDWDLILSWCILAAQQDTNGNSFLGLPVDAITEGGDKYFAKWINQQLDTTFRPCPSLGIPRNVGMWGGANPHEAMQVSAMMATEVRKGVALGLQAMGQLQRDPSQLGGGGYKADTKGYTKDDIVALMGFTGVYNGHNLPNIWELFNATNHCHLFARMKQWAYDCRIQIDTSIYLEQETIKAIVELQFNPGEGVAHLTSASKGLSILVCRAHTTQETERICKQEQALSATEKTRQLEDLLCFCKGTTQAPADDFWELKMNVATLMSLVWVLFGSNCNYYKSLRQIHKTLKLKEVYMLKLKFSVSIYVDIRYLRPHFYSYPLMPSMTGTGVLQVRAPKCFA